MAPCTLWPALTSLLLLPLQGCCFLAQQLRRHLLPWHVFTFIGKGPSSSSAGHIMASSERHVAGMTMAQQQQVLQAFKVGTAALWPCGQLHGHGNPPHQRRQWRQGM